MNTFRKLLQKKLTIKPTSKFEKEFWKKFDSEFAPSKKSVFDFSQNWLMATGSLSAAVLLFALVRLAPSPTFEPYENAQNGAFEMVSSVEMLQDYELFSQLSEIPRLPELDEEWEILIGETT